MLIVGWLNYRFAKGLGRSFTYDIMHVTDITPSIPRGKQTRYRVRKAMLESWHNYSSSAAYHALHIAQHERRGDTVGLACSSTSNNNCCLGTNELSQALWLVKVYFLLGLAHLLQDHSTSRCQYRLLRIPHRRYRLSLRGISQSFEKSYHRCWGWA